ncbi:ATP-dependent helicase [Metabacillus dongyingensis]|uniref:ATP-dependent helicase n=1 Tax=Metabacillus dongyingensis TaxID=2874282 RepID=UPI003B8CAACC
MICGKFKDEFIQLPYLARERFQQIYEAGIHGKVTCACCNQPLKLYLGIKQKPYFYHADHAIHEQCEQYSETIQQAAASKEIVSKETNGFRMPAQRAIGGDQPRKESAWKPYQLAKLGQTPLCAKEKTAAKSILEVKLDDTQLEAVTTIDGPLLVLAGAGSGKTRVLTTRALYMMEEQQINPASIMLVTFTSKAAQEMKHRLNEYATSPSSGRLVCGTFHSIFYKILMHSDPERWNGQHLIKWDWQKEQYIKSAGRELGLNEKEFPYDQALQQISFWKNTFLSNRGIKPETEWEEQALFLYEKYEEMKSAQNQFDFDDMLIKCYELLAENPELLAQYQNRFRYFLVDEFQDINPVQYELLKMLSSHTNQLCVVGDDDQSIYAFRGSDPSFILNFKSDFSDAKIVTLAENYRSSHEIVSSANLVISKNKQRHPKAMNAQYQNEAPPLFFFPHDEEEEATLVVNDMKEKLENGAKPGEFAVLYRTHTAGRAIFERLAQSSIPFTIEQEGLSFYERRMVKGLLAYLRLGMNPDDSAAIVHVMSALFIKQSALNDLKAFSITHDCTFVEALTKLESIQPFQKSKIKRIVPMFSKLKALRPTAAIDMIEKDMGFSDFLKKRGNEGNAIEKGSDDLKDLRVLANKFDTVAELLAHVEHMTAKSKEWKQKREPNAVQLMTVHRAKGLEYEHVYILGAVDGGIPHDFSLDSFRKGDEKPIEEERRLMYVAMTRAKSSLSVSVPQYRRGRKAIPSRFIRGLMV